MSSNGRLAQVAADLHAVDRLEVRLDVPGGEPTRVQGQDLVVEPDEPALALADDLRLKAAAVPVAGSVDRDLAVLVSRTEISAASAASTSGCTPRSASISADVRKSPGSRP